MLQDTIEGSTARFTDMLICCTAGMIIKRRVLVIYLVRSLRVI